MKLFDSDSKNILPGISEEQFLRIAREYVKSAYPNPDRIGCIERDRLEMLARRKCRPSRDEIDHIGTCSPCFIEYETIRGAYKHRQTTILRGVITIGFVVVLVCGLLLISRESGNGPRLSKSMHIAKEISHKLVLDLRPYERFRGEGRNATGAPTPPILERTTLSLTILLPTGSEEGKYHFELFDPTGVRRLDASAVAVIRNYVTTADIQLDLRTEKPGPFFLSVRQANEAEAKKYLVELR